MRARLATGLTLLSLLALAACGEERLSQPEFAKQGNALCADADRRSRSLGEPKDLEGVARQLDELVKIAEDVKRKFQALKPPEDKQAAFDAYIGSIQRQIDKAKQLGAAARKEDQKALESELANVEQIETDTRNRARELGLDGCARSS